jgi:cysteine-rich repeat protein
MRLCLILLAAAVPGCFNDQGPQGESSTSDASTTTVEPTTEPQPSCGDGVMQAGESCDNGPANDQYAACSNACILNICGDGVRGPDEQCDDGDADENNACTSKCGPPRCGDSIVHLPGEMCDDGDADENDDCTTRCAPPECGDGILSGDEECDLGSLNANTGHCTKTCKNKACGDGYAQPGEACDEGIDPVLPCTAQCTFDTCGDGVIQEPEVCDDPMVPTCTPVCTVNVCGDGFLLKDEMGGGEICDDGNLVGGDGCAADCTVSVCGDGELAVDEECDDGNTDGGDACGPTCRRDTRYVFVSSLRYAAGAIGSVSFADGECQKMAMVAGLPGNYKAWLSNGAVSPATRFSKSLDRAYVLPFSVQSGAAKLVAESWIDLVDGSLKHEINVTEKGEQLSFGSSCETATQIAWTATSASAGPYDTTTTCEQWSTSVPQKFGVAGLIGSTGDDWTEGCPMARCDLQARIYCFEQP